MKKIIFIMLFITIIPLSLMGIDLISNQRILKICEKIGYTAELKDIGESKAVIITDTEGVSILKIHNFKLTLVTFKENYLFKSSSKELEKINNFNRKIIFARTFINERDIALSSNLNIINGASDKKIINYIGAFMAIRDIWLENFKK